MKTLPRIAYPISSRFKNWTRIGIILQEERLRGLEQLESVLQSRTPQNFLQ